MFRAWSSSPGRRAGGGGCGCAAWVCRARPWPGTCWRESGGTTNAFTDNGPEVRSLRRTHRRM